MFWKKLETKHFLIAIGLLALGLRLYRLNWDSGQHLHPDERYMTMVATAIQWPSSLREYLSPQTSPLSPYNTDYKAYIYGTFPLFLVKATADLVGWGDYARLHLVGRLVSALFDIGTLLLIYLIGRRIYTRRVGLLAAALYAVTVLAIQQSHFFTVDNFATFWLVASFALIPPLTKNRSLSRAPVSGLLGIAFGLAAASKISSLIFGGVIGLGFLLGFVSCVSQIDRRQAKTTSGVISPINYYVLLVTIFAVSFYVTFRLVQPYAFASPNWFDLTPEPNFWQALSFQRRAISGEVIFPPQYQWFNTTPYWFPLKNLLLWGLGLPLGITAIAGIAFLFFKTFNLLRKFNQQKDTGASILRVLLLVWPLGLFLYQGGNFVKTMRYLLPTVPFLTLIAAYALDQLLRRAQTPVGCIFARLSLGGTLLGSLLWALAYVNIYSVDTTRVAASKWIYQNIPQGVVLANEHWDDPLPLKLPRAKMPAASPQIPAYVTFQMEVYNPDINADHTIRQEKIKQLYNDLSRADYVILSSPRAAGSIGRLPKQFPLMSRYYKLLNAGGFGFKEVAEITSRPNLFGVTIDDESAEEAFWVYDHPPVRIYRKINLPDYDRFASLFTVPNYN